MRSHANVALGDIIDGDLRAERTSCLLRRELGSSYRSCADLLALDLSLLLQLPSLLNYQLDNIYLTSFF